mmetsp:Transcript_21989/g.19544  ORF Transcript_21989/g.19544 Transcript_21989/m.19544 type:complete len:231 (+) Transcript_21989:250-942(+)
MMVRMFTVHKELKDNLWIYPTEESREFIDKDILNELKPMEIELDPENYDVYLNPKITAITDVHEYDWERCGSYIGCKAQVRRPIGIRLLYQDETGELMEKDFFDFKARVICHEIEHLNGKDMMHWTVSEGSVEIDEHFEQEYEAFDKEVKNYNEQILGMKKDDPTMFKRRQEFDDAVIQGKWNPMKKEYHQSEPFFGKEEQFNANFAIDLYKAGQKDKRRKELRKNFVNK